jgi:tetratricopeptide (TPR) repeat protein
MAAGTLEQLKLLRQRNALCDAASKAWNTGKQTEAIAALEQALAINLRLTGPWHQSTDSIATMLGAVHKVRGEWEKEAKYRRVVIEARRALFGRGHYQTVDAHLELEEALAQPRRTPQQRAALAGALGLHRRALGLQRMGQVAKAIPLARQALEIYKEVLGEKHREYAISLNNLATLYKDMGDHKQALPLHKQALKIDKEVLGEKHPHYALSLNNLATLYKDMGDHKQALPLYKQALAIKKEALGDKHPLYATCLNNLAALYKDMGGLKAALALHKQALAIRKALGEKHPDYAQSLNNLATLYSSMGDYKSALPLYKQALAIKKEVLGEKHPLYATSLNNLAALYDKMGEYKQALPLYKQALGIFKEAQGEKHPSYANSLTGLALLYKNMGDHKVALPLYKHALAINKEALGEKHPSYAHSLNNLALLYMSMGDHKQALRQSKQALEVYKEVMGDRHPRYATSLTNLAGLYHSMGDNKAALPLFQKALAIRKEALGERHPDYANSLNNLASLYKDMGDHKQALPLFQKALTITKETLGEKHLQCAISLSNLAALYQEMGEHKQALPLHKQALAIRKEAQGEKHPDFAISLNNLAALYQYMGDHKQALPLYQKALQIRKEAVGEKHPEYANSLSNLAMLYQDMGDHKQALPLCKQALEVHKEVLGEKHPSYGTSLNNLALLYKDMGDYKAALPLSKQALQIRKEVLGEKHPQYATSLNHLAGLHQEMGDLKQALPLCQQALSIRKEALGEKHPDYAGSLNALAGLYHSMGDRKAALLLCQQALRIWKATLGERHPYYAHSLHNLAALYQDMGDHKQALALSEEAIHRTLSYLRDSASVQSDRQQLAAANHVRPLLDARLSLMDDGGYGHVLAWKGAVLLRQRQRRLFSALSADPKTRQAANELQAATLRISAQSASSRPARERLEQLTLEQERLEAKLSGLSVEAKAAFEDHTLNPKTLAKSLPEGVVLVDYLFYWRAGILYRDGRTNWVRHLVACVSRRGKPTVRVELGPAGDVANAVRLWRKALTAREDGQAEGAALKRRIWSALEGHTKGAKAVLVSPDEALAAVPFAALPGNKPGTYLIEDVALAMVPVPRLLPQMLKRPDRANRLKPSLLVVGDVDYDRAGPSPKADAGGRGAPLGARRDWGRLGDTFAEVAAVSRSFSALFEGGSVTDLSKGKATKARVREALRRVRYAHLATHGFFAHEGVKTAAGAKEPQGLFGRSGVTGWHPLLVSGVVLAGANKEPKEGEEDGILTALEVSEMELPKLELVVLSACETGLGRSAGGEGLLGLQRAFQVAGARTVVASLWQVDDRASRALMADFYAAAWDTDKIISRAEALRQAQLKMLKDGAARGGIVKLKVPKGKPAPRLPPYYWAAFVLSGDWR